MRYLNVLLLLSAFALVAQAGVIVPDLDDSGVITALTDTGAANTGVPNITTGKITFAARFNPDASMSTAAPALIIENGGTSNGTGLYLVNGNVVFAGKYGSKPGFSSATLDDIDFTDNAIAVAVGQVTYGAENNVFVSYDLSTGELTGSVNGSITQFNIAGSNTGINFDGNNSVYFINFEQQGWLGGLGEIAYSESGPAGEFLTAENCIGLVQTEGYTDQLGQIFNDVTSVPEPCTMALLGLGGLFIRRRK